MYKICICISEGLQSKIETEHRFSVIRGGEAHDVVVNELVVGDIGRVKYGKKRC